MNQINPGAYGGIVRTAMPPPPQQTPQPMPFPPPMQGAPQGPLPRMQPAQPNRQQLLAQMLERSNRGY